MGDMSFTEAKAELQFLLGNRTDADTTNSTRLKKWLNDGYFYMCHPSVHRFREMQAISNATVLVSGTNEYSMETLEPEEGNSAGTVVAIRWVSHIESTTYSATANRRKLTPRSIRWLESRSNRSGRPLHYIMDGNSMFLYGVPSTSESGQILRIGYYREPGFYGGTEGNTELSTYYDRPLLKFAQAFAETDLGERAKSLVTLKEATGLLNNAVDKNELEAEDDGFRTEVILHSAMGF